MDSLDSVRLEREKERDRLDESHDKIEMYYLAQPFLLAFLLGMARKDRSGQLWKITVIHSDRNALENMLVARASLPRAGVAGLWSGGDNLVFAEWKRLAQYDSVTKWCNQVCPGCVTDAFPLADNVVPADARRFFPAELRDAAVASRQEVSGGGAAYDQMVAGVPESSQQKVAEPLPKQPRTNVNTSTAKAFELAENAMSMFPKSVV